jgi:hypothetical protein
MSRIRSIHPGLFTDEAFASASPMARLLIFGIWTEAWDDGVFAWKPLTLKMRIFPADTVDVEALLSELEALNIIKQFGSDTQRFGAVRNFCKFQRPKKPNSSGVLPESLQLYVAFTKGNGEPVRNQFGTGGEKPLLMEDGGGNRKERKKVREKLVPSEQSKKSVTSVLEILSECLSEKTARGLIDHRKAKRSPLTRRAAELLVIAFTDFGDPERCAEAMILNGWQGFKPDWMANNARAGPVNGHRQITAFSRPSVGPIIAEFERQAVQGLEELKIIEAELKQMESENG